MSHVGHLDERVAMGQVTTAVHRRDTGQSGRTASGSGRKIRRPGGFSDGDPDLRVAVERVLVPIRRRIEALDRLVRQRERWRGVSPTSVGFGWTGSSAGASCSGAGAPVVGIRGVPGCPVGRSGGCRHRRYDPAANRVRPLATSGRDQNGISGVALDPPTLGPGDRLTSNGGGRSPTGGRFRITPRARLNTPVALPAP